MSKRPKDLEQTRRELAATKTMPASLAMHPMLAVVGIIARMSIDVAETLRSIDGSLAKLAETDTDDYKP